MSTLLLPKLTTKLRRAILCCPLLGLSTSMRAQPQRVITSEPTRSRCWQPGYDSLELSCSRGHGPWGSCETQLLGACHELCSWRSGVSICERCRFNRRRPVSKRLSSAVPVQISLCCWRTLSAFVDRMLRRACCGASTIDRLTPTVHDAWCTPNLCV